MVTAICGVQLQYRKRPTDLVLRLGLNESIDQFGYNKRCLLLWICVKERGLACHEKGIRH